MAESADAKLSRLREVLRRERGAMLLSYHACPGQVVLILHVGPRSEPDIRITAATEKGAIRKALERLEE